jgi:hypothetical protein
VATEMNLVSIKLAFIVVSSVLQNENENEMFFLPRRLTSLTLYAAKTILLLQQHFK